MKKNKLKFEKRRVLSHHYRNKNNISLRALLYIASLKRKNNVLARNNRCLAQELQKTRCDMAANSNRIDECAKMFQQVLFARVKAKDMVHTFTKLVNDLDELTKYLDQINSQVTFSGNGLPCTIKKIPTIESIEEVSVSSINPILEENSPSPQVITTESTCSVTRNERSSVSRNKRSSCTPALFSGSPHPSTSKNKRCSYTTALQAISHYPSDSWQEKQNFTSKQSITDVQLMSEDANEKSSTAKNDIKSINFEKSTDEMPVSFPECTEAKNKRISKKNKSSGSQKSGSLSLTPELEIDIPSRLKRSSERRRTLFKVSNSSKSKSGRNVSHESEMPFLVQGKEQLTETTENHENEVGICPLNIMNDNSTKETSDEACYSESLPNTKSKISKFMTCVPSSVVVPPIVSNTTLLLNEDMELTENVSAQILVENCVRIENQNCMPEIKSYVETSCVTKENCASVKELSKLLPHESNISKSISNFNSNTQSIPVKQIESVTCFESPLSDLFNLPTPKRTCRKNVKYSIFFSDVSDDEYSPNRLKLSREKISSKGKRHTAIFIPTKSTQVPVESHSIPDSSENLDQDTSIFALNASQSEKDKVSKLSKNKQSAKKRVLVAKPLLQNCNVTKLKGSDYKFTKTKHALNNNRFESFNRQLKSSESCLYKFPSRFQNNNDISEHRQNYLNYETSSCLEEELKETAEEFKSVLKDTGTTSPVVCTPKSESKRVSFASTDMVCNFKKMSLSKNIAINRKMRRVSKSAFEFTDSFDKDDKCTSTVTSTDNIVDSFLQFDGETELYAFSLLENVNCPALKETQNLDNVEIKEDNVQIKEHIISNPPSLECAAQKESELSSRIGISSGEVENEPYRSNATGLVSDVLHVVNLNQDKNKKKESVSGQKKLSSKKYSKKSVSHPKNVLFPNLEGRKSNIKLYRDSKENLIQSTFDTTARKNIKENNVNFLNSHKSNTNNQKDISRKCKKKSSSKAKKITMKKGEEKSVESFLILKDRMNLESISPLTQKTSTEKLSKGTDLKILPKRLSKHISYKEPLLNKKMRREN